MKALVTGSSGFIGSHIVETLVKNSYEVVAVDVVQNNSLPNKVTFYELDIRDYTELYKAIKGVDLVIHLAALINARESIENPDLYHNVNVGGTLNILKLCRDLNVKKLIFASSAAVYGEPQYLPIDEKHPLRPLNPYGATKVACEAYISAFHSLYKIPTVILRIFNVYGPKQLEAHTGVISNFIKRALSGESLIIYGDGLSLIHI